MAMAHVVNPMLPYRSPVESPRHCAPQRFVGNQVAAQLDNKGRIDESD